jgi:hypothetical protein
MQIAPGGSVLIETQASSAAIICKIPPGRDGYRENEYLVDRRGLKSVSVLEKYAEIMVKEQQAGRRIT